jgi:chorismate mutase
MSPKNRKKLEKIRKKLDRLDNEFLRLIKIRTDLVNKVVKLKEFKGEIVDTKRIKKILFNIRRKSLKKKIDSTVTNKIWKNMILTYINHQRKNFKKK